MRRDRGIGLDADRADVAFHPSGVMRSGSGAHTVVASTAPLGDEGMAGDARRAAVPGAGPVR